MNPPQKMTVEELLERNPIKRPTADEQGELIYDISEEINNYIQREEQKLIELYLIRQGFKYNEELSDTKYECRDAEVITTVWFKIIEIPLNRTHSKKLLIRIDIHLSTENDMGLFWVDGINFSICNYDPKINNYDDMEYITVETINPPKKQESMNREIYILKKLKYVLDTLK